MFYKNSVKNILRKMYLSNKIEIFNNDRSATQLSKSIHQYTEKPGKILRPLGYNEIFFDVVCRQGSWGAILNSVFDSKINLYNNIDKLNASIHQWSLLHPFLRCKVVNANQDNETKNDISLKRYFVSLGDDLKLDNVTYLRYMADNKIDNYDNLYLFLVNYESNNLLSTSSGLLWRMTLVQIDKIDHFRYCLLLRFNHSITEGRNMCFLHYQFLQMLEAFYCNQDLSSVYKPKTFTESLETYLYENNEELIDKVNIHPDKLKLFDYSSDAVSVFQEEPKNSQNDLSKLHGVFKSYDFKETNYFNSNLILDSIFTRITYDDKILENILENCAKYKTKPIGFFGTLSALTLHKTYQDYLTEDLIKNGILYSTTVSLKSYIKLPINVSDMGYYIAPTVQLFEPPYIQLEAIEFESEFWKRAALESEKVHNLLSNKDVIEYPKLRKKWLNKNLHNLEVLSVMKNSFNFHFTLTNIGNVEKTTTVLSTENFKGVDTLFSTSFGNNMPPMMALLVLTHKNKLDVQIGYSRKRTSDQVINTFKENFNHILQKLIN